MKLTIMQPYFFPYIGYWQLTNAVDRFVIYDDVNYILSGWVNRNRILSSDEWSYITVPLQHSSPNKLICNTLLQSSWDWRRKLVKMVEITYRRAPCFARVFPVVERILHHETDSLSDYLLYQLQTLAVFIGINTEFVVASRSYEDKDLSGQERIIDICKREGATIYVNPPGGQALYDRATFAKNNLDLKFLIPAPVEYKQFGSVHVPWLSIIDVMMFNSPSQLHSLLNQYELV